MSFEIKSGVPIPERQSFPRGPRGSVYPLGEMIEGQSFDIPVRDEKEANQKRSYLSALGKSRGVKAVTRYFPNEDGNGGIVTCWHGGDRDPAEDARNAARAAAAKAAREAKKAGAVRDVPLNADATGAADADEA